MGEVGGGSRSKVKRKINTLNEKEYCLCPKTFKIKKKTGNSINCGIFNVHISVVG